MKRFHVHVGVTDIAEGIRFYSALFDAQPTVVKSDYAKWMLDDPRVNFAISTRSGQVGLDHLGMQTDSGEELAVLERQLQTATSEVVVEKGTTCCYAASDKAWAKDPAGIAWEAFHTLNTVPMFRESTQLNAIPVRSGCCTPDFGSGSSGCCP
jgi:lactoylglutathione lyase